MEQFLKDYIGRCQGYNIQPTQRVVDLLSSYIKLTIQSKQHPNNLKLNGNHDPTFRQRLTDIDLIPLCELLEDDTLFASADFSFNELTDESASNALSNLLSSNYVLRYLSLKGNRIESSGALALASALKKNTALECLDLSLNAIGEKGGMAIVDALSENAALCALNLTQTDIKLNTMIQLSILLKDHPTLSILSLGRPLIREHANINTMLTHLSHALRFNTVLQVLDLSKCHIRCDGLRILLDGIATSNTLSYLNLTSNAIGVDGACYLADYLQHPSCSLAQLFLGYNHIDRAGGNAFASALSHNTSLKSLNLEHNAIGDVPLYELAHTLLQDNRSLLRLKIAGNHFGQRAMAAFYELHQSILQFQLHKDDEDHLDDDILSLELDIVPYSVHAIEDDPSSLVTFYLADANTPASESVLDSALILQLLDDMKEQLQHMEEQQPHSSSSSLHDGHIDGSPMDFGDPHQRSMGSSYVDDVDDVDDAYYE